MKIGVWRTYCGSHIVGKHWGNSSSEQTTRARTIAVRCVSGGLCLSLAVLTFGGFQGLSAGMPSGLSAAVPATGAVGPETLDPETLDPLADAAATVAPGTPAAVTADAQALVAFSRSTVQTVTREGIGGELNVASASLSRPAAGFLMAPLESLVPSSPFGLRTSPLTGLAGEFHWGQDFAAPCGTRVYSADAGVVRAVGWHPWGGGNRVEIDHGNGLITTYNHLEAIAVKKGDSVRVGEVIARVGTTGSSTGCHLHFETILNGSHTDPMDWTLLPIKQVDQLGTIEMTSYAPDAGKASNTGIGWAIPVREDLTHVVAGGVQEQPAAVAAKPSASASAAATEAAADKPSATPSATPTPTRTRHPDRYRLCDADRNRRCEADCDADPDANEDRDADAPDANEDRDAHPDAAGNCLRDADSSGADPAFHCSAAFLGASVGLSKRDGGCHVEAGTDHHTRRTAGLKDGQAARARTGDPAGRANRPAKANNGHEVSHHSGHYQSLSDAHRNAEPLAATKPCPGRNPYPRASAPNYPSD